MMSVPQGEVRRVADVVMRRILEGTYPSGLRLPTETDLAAEFSCGRSTVREALRHLADQGLVQSRRGSGAHVLDWHREGTPALLPPYVALGRFEVPPAALLETMLRLRRSMACEAVRLASELAADERLDEAAALLARAPSLEADPVAHALNELEFYRSLVCASEMWPAVWTLNALWSPLHEINRLFAPAIGPVRRDFQRTMETLLEKIRSKEADDAVEYADSWFKKVDGHLMRTLAALFGESAPQSRQPKTTPRRNAPDQVSKGHARKAARVSSAPKRSEGRR